MVRTGLIALLMLGALAQVPAIAQTFTRVVDQSNPIVTDPGPFQYAGASWVDYDNDGDQDLFINNDRLYRNDGAGTFVRVPTVLGSAQSMSDQITGYGNSWADYDNDGDLDCYISSATSFLYRNDGGAFTRVTSGTIGNGNAQSGWACAWGDYDNDGYVDLAITYPTGFVPTAKRSNHLLRNSGPPDYGFARVQNAITSEFAPFTVGTWSDYDSDGDIDFFIGAGPATGVLGPDFLYRNLLRESGEATFERITGGTLGDVEHDGQVWSWIDYDNDLDLDAFVTNWGGPLGGLPNRLFRRDGDSFVEVSAGDITADVSQSLGVAWADYDNDGDLDCYVANDNGTADGFYRNEAGIFTALRKLAFAQPLTHRGAAAADYDNDGDIDLVAVGPGTATALYRNETRNGAHWAAFVCAGTRSNRAAIGARLYARATIGGRAVWQMREISAQNSFNGQHSMVAHFGLGDATVVDTLIVRWPSGAVDTLVGIPADRTTSVVESLASSVDDAGAADAFSLTARRNAGSTTIRVTGPTEREVAITVTDLRGRTVRRFLAATGRNARATVHWDGTDSDGISLPAGPYFIRARVGSDVAFARVMM